MIWINFLHFYQPATLEREVIVEAIKKSYQRIIKALIKNKNIKFTINVNGCLLKKMDELGYRSLIDDMKKLAKRGQIELVGTIAYHPIAPLIPEFEIKKQIKLQETILKKYFGDIKLKGFFLPEMAYSEEAAKLIKKLRYEWIILDEIAATGKLSTMDCEKIYLDSSSGLQVVFRQRNHSQDYVPQVINRLLKKHFDGIIITATDAELYGLRHRDVSGGFEKILTDPELKTITISEFIKLNKDQLETKVIPSSWESSEAEILANNPHAIWRDEQNEIQVKIWELANLALDTIQKFSNDPQFDWAELHLRRGLASCTFWWASGKEMSSFKTLSWSPDEIERGLNELIKSIRTLDDPDTREIKIKAEELYLAIKKMVWEKHWNQHWKK